MSRVIKTPRAIRDLASIWNKIALESNVSRARSLVANIDQTLGVLAEHPNIGRARPDLHPRIRSFPVGNYIILYEVIPGGVQVVRVLYGAMNLPFWMGKHH